MYCFSRQAVLKIPNNPVPVQLLTNKLCLFHLGFEAG